MAYSIVQSANDYSTISVASLAATLGSNVTAGNTCIALAMWTNASTSNGSCSDNGANSYNQLSSVYNDGTSGYSQQIFVIQNHPGGTSTVVTATPPSSSNHFGLYVLEVSGLSTSGGVVFAPNTSQPVTGPGNGAGLVRSTAATNTGPTSIMVGLSTDGPKNATTPGIVSSSGTSLTTLPTPFNWREGGETFDFHAAQHERLLSSGSQQSKFTCSTAGSFDRFLTGAVMIDEGASGPSGHAPMYYQRKVLYFI